MRKYRKKPVEVYAFEYVFYSCEFLRWAKDMEFDNWQATTAENNLLINTCEGVLRVEEGDWIIKGIKGEFYPCKPDIFELTYELVED